MATDFQAGIFILIMGLLLYETVEYINGRASHDWVAVQAKIDSVFAEQRENEDEEESRPRIKFTYIYLGKRYTSTKFGFGDFWTRSYGKTLGEISGMISGKDIIVHVNPKKPRQATYLKGYHGYYHIQLLVLGILAILCAATI